MNLRFHGQEASEPSALASIYQLAYGMVAPLFDGFMAP